MPGSIGSLVDGKNEFVQVSDDHPGQLLDEQRLADLPWIDTREPHYFAKAPRIHRARCRVAKLDFDFERTQIIAPALRHGLDNSPSPSVRPSADKSLQLLHQVISFVHGPPHSFG